MAINFPGPYEVRIFYTVAGREHVQRLNCDVPNDPAPGTTWSTLTALRRDSTQKNLEIAVDAWVAVMDDFIVNTGSFARAELWKYTPGTFVAVFISSDTLGVVGALTTPVQPASQVIWTLRTQEGGVMKIALEDTSIAPGPTEIPPFGAAKQAVVDLLTGNEGVWLARDTSYPVTPIAFHPGQNEALFKRIYR